MGAYYGAIVIFDDLDNFGFDFIGVGRVAFYGWFSIDRFLVDFAIVELTAILGNFIFTQKHIYQL